MNSAVLVLDCGATSVRAVAVAPDGRTLAKAARPNSTIPDPGRPDWHLWPLDTILDLLGQCSREVMASLAARPGTPVRLQGLAVTTFGVDGAPVRRGPDGSTVLLHPVISWKCPRTQPVMASTEALFGGPEALQTLGGVGRFAFNTIYKLAWLEQHQPRVLAQAEAWLFMPSLIAARLGADWYTDRTMAGTSGLANPATGCFNPAILDPLGVPASLFPPLKDAGEPVGSLSAQGAALLGLPAGLPLFAAGHDTQCALIGSGAGINQPVLSSGTWEILMVRTPRADLAAISRQPAATCELDARTGLLNPGLQWLASGVLEWVKACFFADGTDYAGMIAQAREVPPGSGGVAFNDGFFLAGSPGAGAITGLSPQTPRAALYRASLEGLAGLLARQLDALQGMCGFKATELILVGGGTRNPLWNQIKADSLGLPLRVVQEPETTVLGAACCVYAGLGRHATPESARAAFSLPVQTIQPGPQADAYHALSVQKTTP